MTSSAASGVVVIWDRGHRKAYSEDETGKNRDALLSENSYRHGCCGLHRSFDRVVPMWYPRADVAKAVKCQHRWDPDRFSCASEASSKEESQKSGHLSRCGG